MRTAEIERTKLTATFLNSVASGTVVAALIGPFVGTALGTIHPLADPLNVSGLSLFGLVFAIVLHFLARRMLLRIGD